MDVNALDNRCPSCKASITFNPVNQMWDCSYCGSKFTLEQMQQYNNVSVVSSNDVVSQLVPESVMKNIDLYRCNSCGAQIMADEHTTSTFCVYCGNTAILKDRIEQGRAPNFIIPFKKTKEDAIKGFKKITRNKLLAPSCFKNVKNIEKITGIYIPFWAYDLEANGEAEFEAWDSKSWSDSKYKYTKVDRYSIRKSGHFDFNKVLADASTRFPDDLMDSLEPFDYTDLRPYNHAYLAGFLAEKYDVDESVGMNRVVGRTKDTALGMIEGTIGHQKRKLVNDGIRVSSRYTHYIMLPVWMVNIKYKNKYYTFAMNGQTGRLVGNMPVSFLQTIFWSVIFFAIFFVVGIAFVWFFM